MSPQQSKSPPQPLFYRRMLRPPPVEDPSLQAWLNAAADEIDAVVPPTYAGILVNGNSTAQTVTGGSATTLDFDAGSTAVDMVFSDATSDANASLITVLQAGDYQVNGQFSFSGDVSVSWTIHMYKNASLTTLGTHRKLGTGGDVGSCSFSAPWTFAVNDVIAPWIARVGGSGNNDVVLQDGQFWVKRIG